MHSHGPDEIVGNSDEHHCFCNVALLFVCEQLKEDEPQLIRTCTQS